jgi:hypothetical protein
MSAPSAMKGPSRPLRCPKPRNHKSRVHYAGARPFRPNGQTRPSVETRPRMSTSSWARWRAFSTPMTFPLAKSRACIRDRDALADGVMAGPPRPASATGWVRSSAWIWVSSSTQRTSARSGGFSYSPTTSRTFSTESGFDGWFRGSCFWAIRNVRQIRVTAAGCRAPISSSSH